MSDIIQPSDSPQTGITPGSPAYPVAKVEAHALEPIERQAKLTQQVWRSIAHVTAKRALHWSRSFSKVDARKMQAIVHMAAESHATAYGKGTEQGSRGPAHVLIQLFGQSSAGERIAANLTRMIPTAKVVDEEPRS